MQEKVITVKQFFDLDKAHNWIDSHKPEEGYTLFHSTVEEMLSGAYRASIIEIKTQGELDV